jgi:hypothetical protein
MKNKIIGVIAGAMLLVPGVAFASTLTQSQVSAIIGLLQAFGVAQSTIDIVYADLTPQSVTTTPSDTSTSTPVTETTQPSTDNSTPATQTAPIVTGVEQPIVQQPAPVVPSCTLTYVEFIPTTLSVHLKFTLTNTSGGFISGIDGVGNMRQMYNVALDKPYQGLAGNALLNDTYGYEYSTTTVYTLATKDTSCQVTVPPLSQN